MRTVVLVHGAWHGPWCWASVLAGLDEVGIHGVPVDLPGPELADDAAAVEAVIEDVVATGAERVVLVGHSYGGAVITEAGAHPAVDRLVYLAAFAPDAGESVADLARQETERSGLAEAIRFLDDGTTVLDPGVAPEVLYADCEPTDVERALGLLRPQSMATFTGVPRAVAWRQRPTTYAVCAADRAVDPALQRAMAARIPEVALVEWPGASHSPFLARPAAVVDLLAALAVDAP